MDRPKIEAYETGSAPSAEIFTTIMKQSLQYLNITPTMEEIIEQPNNGFVVPDYIGTDAAEAQAELEEAGMDVYLLGDGAKISAQLPLPNKSLLTDEKVFLKTDSEQFELPDMTGWSIRDVLKISDLLHLSPNIFGNGFLHEQSIAPGQTVREGDHFVAGFSDSEKLTEQGTEEEQAEHDDSEQQTESLKRMGRKKLLKKKMLKDLTKI